MVSLVPAVAPATEFTAGVVMEKMKEQERYVFVAGIIEGLAMARYAKDQKQSQGMQCIYDWFYKSPDTLQTIYAGFQRYPSYPPGTVVHVLTKQKCGE
ncbi:MAG: hypothetical protein WDN25_13680 [Acetobacteraceae bacterium]